MKNTQVVLAQRPVGIPRPEDFRVVESAIHEPQESEFHVEKLYISLDAGFRNWMY